MIWLCVLWMALFSFELIKSAETPHNKKSIISFGKTNRLEFSTGEQTKPKLLWLLKLFIIERRVINCSIAKPKEKLIWRSVGSDETQIVRIMQLAADYFYAANLSWKQKTLIPARITDKISANHHSHSHFEDQYNLQSIW